MRADLVRCLRGLFGKALDLGSHHSESSASLSGTRRFDRGIECEKVGLASDFADQLDYVANTGCILEQPLNSGIRAIGFQKQLFALSP